MIPEGKTQKEFAKEAVEMLLDNLNIMGSDKPIVEGILEALQMNHRTLQQNFWRAMVAVMKQYAEFRHDLRNEGAVEFCNAVKKMIEDNPKTEYLPFI